VSGRGWRGRWLLNPGSNPFCDGAWQWGTVRRVIAQQSPSHTKEPFSTSSLCKVHHLPHQLKFSPATTAVGHRKNELGQRWGPGSSSTCVLWPVPGIPEPAQVESPGWDLDWWRLTCPWFMEALGKSASSMGPVFLTSLSHEALLALASPGMGDLSKLGVYSV
jgi:hypothetical protein